MMCLITFFSLLGAKKDPNSNKFDQFRKLVTISAEKPGQIGAQTGAKTAQTGAKPRKRAQTRISASGHF